MNANKKHATARSRIMWEVTLLVWFVFTLSAILTALFYRSSSNNLIEKSKEKLIATEANNISTSFQFSNQLTTKLAQATLPKSNQAEMATAVLTKTPAPIQLEANKVMKDYVEQETMGIKMVNIVLPSTPPAIPEPLIIITSHQELVFNDVPESVMKIVEGGKDYGFIEKGIPEWNMDQEQLVVVTQAGEGYAQGEDQLVYAVGVKPMHEELKSIDDYYANENNKINTFLAAVIGISVTALFLITFVILNYLINSRITKPIDELSEAAEKVLEGDLDVEVPIRENEEFANLKKAFNEMIAHIRKMISRASGEE